jgi:betaine reductase
MDMENQTAIKRLVDENGADNLVVVLGAADLEGAEIAAETVTVGDPSFAGPLSGVSRWWSTRMRSAGNSRR